MSICKACVSSVSYDDEEFRGKAAGDKKSVHLMGLPNTLAHFNMSWTPTKN